MNKELVKDIKCQPTTHRYNDPGEAVYFKCMVILKLSASLLGLGSYSLVLMDVVYVFISCQKVSGVEFYSLIKVLFHKTVNFMFILILLVI